MVVAVRAGRELLGSLWVETAVPFDDRRRRVLADGARTAALHLLRSRASADLERQVESDLVTRLLEGIGDAPAMISQLGLPGKGLRVVALQAHAEDEQHAGALLAFEHVTTGFGWSRPGPQCAVRQHRLHPAARGGRHRRPRARLGGDRCALASRAHVGLVAGIGGAADAPSLPASRREADECLALHAAQARAPAGRLRRVVGPDRAAPAACGHRGRAVCPTEVPSPISDDTTDRHGTHYVATLRAWLAAHGDIAGRRGRPRRPPEHRALPAPRRWTRSLHLATDHPDQRLALIIALAAMDDDRLLVRLTAARRRRHPAARTRAPRSGVRRGRRAARPPGTAPAREEHRGPGGVGHDHEQPDGREDHQRHGVERQLEGALPARPLRVVAKALTHPGSSATSWFSMSSNIARSRSSSMSGLPSGLGSVGRQPDDDRDRHEVLVVRDGQRRPRIVDWIAQLALAAGAAS